MGEQSLSVEKLLHDLKERSKELNTLYRIEEILSQNQLQLSDVLQKIVEVLPNGWKFPDMCQAKIRYQNQIFQTDGFVDTPICLLADIHIEEKVEGTITVCYKPGLPYEKDHFLKEEHRLIQTIAERIGEYILYRRLKEVSEDWESAKKLLSEKSSSEWKVIIDLLERTDQKLCILISRKMIYHLFASGIREAKEILETMSQDRKIEESGTSPEDINRPSQKQSLDNLLLLSRQTFSIAQKYLSDAEIFNKIQKWILEDKSSFLLRVLANIDSPLVEVIDAVTRFRYSVGEQASLTPTIGKGMRVALIRRFFSDSLDFINIAKHYINIQDFYELIQRIIFSSSSYGRLGGKSAGLFLAEKILKESPEHTKMLSDLRVPKTWYITADNLINFVYYNNLEETTEQKYKDIDQIRLEYPNIIQIFKNSFFPPEIIKGLNQALEEFGEKPLIVRSSSLLEDRMGTAFSGKYKSLFLANQGSKQERLHALLDAIAEVYASVFSPDPIEYRSEKGLLDFHEEMGIMIQEVVGIKIGKYFLPAFSGVAFSNNEFRWSPRIKREDGLIRLVLGLGTRAVDRIADDYPVLISPGKPSLRANVTPEDIQHYSPKKLDLINLETNSFETIAIPDLLKQYGDQFPHLHHYVSIIRDNHIYQPTSFDLDFQKNDKVVTFESLITRTPFIKKIHYILNYLQEKMHTPVDIEFASDGVNFYLLQCRPQSSGTENIASPIPQDIAPADIVFTAEKYISNGKIPDITHVVYVSPDDYNQLSRISDMVDIGRAVSRLNKLLPKHQFVLMGPGRWGSRGDIKLGVPITYSDFNNTSALIEIAKKKGNYVPELSFGTHFFQDLVEASIRYIPLYPDDKGIIFNQIFFEKSQNLLKELLPEFGHLDQSLRVIDISSSFNGKILRILMNADLGKAIGFLAPPSASVKTVEAPFMPKEYQGSGNEEFWQWRKRMAENIASRLTPERFGVAGLYLFGSTKNATAGPCSDIDLLVHFRGDEKQRNDLLFWFEGWSQCLSEMNYLRSGYHTDGLLDIHIITDEDIRKKTSYAIKIGAVTDAAFALSMGKKLPGSDGKKRC